MSPGNMLPWTPWKPRKIGLRGTPIAPTYYGMWTVKPPKWPKSPKFQQNQELAIEWPGTKMASKGIFGQFLKDYGDKTPPLKTIIMCKIKIGCKKRPKKKIGPIQAGTYVHIAILPQF
ncbi:hypothetical protein O181_006960 [Austropuccinia psidii MF-1]|uniref:Uncharacterized protein n=1 Tax=Austropuccinia psidii MF-1 TaxID=1389203 RepID=A0A9Q3GHD5_9BASI|nr:hypothetical protein [Austropuccinia psidii MF-1]